MPCCLSLCALASFRFLRGFAPNTTSQHLRNWISAGLVPAFASRLGPGAKLAVSIVVAAIKDDLANAYSRDELRNAGYLALLHMEELEALKTVRPLGADYSLKLLDQHARWRIGQCGIWS